MSIVKQLMENRVSPVKRNDRETARKMKKWTKTGLLKGIKDEQAVKNLAVLLENQAESLITEASTMSDGAVEGFASVAFPLVRRIFGALIADSIVSVQPMSLPAGLVFFLDFTYTDTKLGYTAGKSVYGGEVVGAGIAGGVDLDNDNGFYNLNTGYSSPEWVAENVADIVSAGTLADDQFQNVDFTNGGAGPFTRAQIITNADQADVDYDEDILTDDGTWYYNKYAIRLATTEWDRVQFDNLVSMLFADPTAGASLFGATAEVVRRLSDVTSTTNRTIKFLVRATNIAHVPISTASTKAINWEFTVNDKYKEGTSLGTILGEDWHLEGPDTRTSGAGYEDMAELDIKINSLPIVAQTKKLKAKWTPELGQDLNAYHNVDAEVELTGILSEHIALEIDREIILDLVKGATAGTYFWNRNPGNFVNKTTGVLITGATAPDFTGNVSEWYETLLETINDLSAVIYRKTLKGGANFLVCGPEVCSLLEMTNGFRAQPMGPDVATTSAGVVKAGSITKKWDIYVDVYFPRNLILVGRKGNSFLESGYVYSPYVPLQVTPTIFGTEDMTPRKGVMTRYAKKMVKPDMYGLVRVINLIQK